MVTRAMLPTPLLLHDRIRIFYCSRDAQNRSRTSFIDVDRNNPKMVLAVNERPVLDVGALGAFDDVGALPSWIVDLGGAIYLFFLGVNIKVTVPYGYAIGLAESRDRGETFTRVFDGPIIDRNAREPYLATSCSVIRQSGIWHMWYTSGTGWFMTSEGKPEVLYDIKYATSVDGRDWKRDNVTCIAPGHPGEAIGRPTVLLDNDVWRMWYSYRGSLDFRDGEDSYRLGYAEARQPTKWTRRDDKAGLPPASDGWDSKMVAYPNVIVVDGRKYLFYNGNGFGQTGFGCAEWVD
jgi:hypothetical protein